MSSTTVAPEFKTITINMGPQHPSTHGVLRLVIELDGESVVSLKPVMGYLHTGMEKIMESKSYTKSLTVTDRMDYLSPLGNNMAYVGAVSLSGASDERMGSVTAPPSNQA